MGKEKIYLPANVSYGSRVKKAQEVSGADIGSTILFPHNNTLGLVWGTLRGVEHPAGHPRTVTLSVVKTATHHDVRQYGFTLEPDELVIVKPGHENSLEAVWKRAVEDR